MLVTNMQYHDVTQFSSNEFYKLVSSIPNTENPFSFNVGLTYTYNKAKDSSLKEVNKSSLSKRVQVYFYSKPHNIV